MYIYYIIFSYIDTVDRFSSMFVTDWGRTRPTWAKFFRNPPKVIKKVDSLYLKKKPGSDVPHTL